jgi:ethanolamine-phosphate cytidylyltransferase
MNINSFICGFIDGCFDLFHYGHLNAIYQSKLNCNKLRLSTHNNEEIYLAKQFYPIYNFEDRIILLKECKFIDILDLDSTPYNTSIEILNDKNCNIFFHGEDGIDKYPLSEINKLNKLVVFNRTKGISTSNIIQRLFDYKNNNIIKKNEDKLYLTSLFNNIQSLNNTLYTSVNKVNIILLKCDWDLFNKNHIFLLNDIKIKYGNTYKIYIDLLSNNNEYENCLFSNYEIRVLLSGIKIIDNIILEYNEDILCNNLVLINTKLNNIFNYQNYIIDDTFLDNMHNIINYKNNLINNIDFTQYINKMSYDK